MPGGTTTYGKDYLLEAAFARGAQIGTFHVALLLSEPGVEDDGSTLDEPTAPSYVRKAVSASATFASFNGGLSNYVGVTFASAAEDWGVIRYYALCDASTGGELICWGKLVSARNVVTGGQPFFEVGSLSFAAFDPAA